MDDISLHVVPLQQPQFFYHLLFNLIIQVFSLYCHIYTLDFYKIIQSETIDIHSFKGVFTIHWVF